MSSPNTNRQSLAIAYLTGQASAAEIDEYQKLYNNEASFRVLVRDVELWLAPLNENVPEVTAPEGLLESIMAEMTPVKPIGAGFPNPSAGAATAGMIAVNDRGTGKWKAIAGAASLVAALAIGSHFVGFNSGNPQDDTPASKEAVAENSNQSGQLLALLSDATQPQLAAIVYDPQTGRIVAHLSNIDVPDDSDLELWLIREGSAAPKSLGVMEKAGEGAQLEFIIPAALSNGTDILAISMERKGGSVSGAPEGPVLLTGGVSSLRRDI